MSAAVTEHPPTLAEREQQALALELARIRVLLENLRDGNAEVPPARPETDFEPAIDRLARLLAMSRFERDLLLLAAAVELDGEIAALAAGILGGGDPRPTFGLALTALRDAHWDALAPGSPLRRWRLVHPDAGPTLVARRLQIDERILHFVTGVEATDERLDGMVEVTGRRAPLAPSQERLAAVAARTAAVAGERVLLTLDGDAADTVAHAVATAAGRAALEVRAVALPPPGRDLANTTRLVERECLLRDAIPVVEAEGAEPGSVSALIDALGCPLVIVVGDNAPATDRVSLRRSIPLPDPTEARSLWRAALGDESGRLESTVEEIAQHFRLAAGAIDAVGREFAATDRSAETLRALCRERARVSLEGLAERIEWRARWDDLVLPQGHLELLRDLVRHVRHRTQVYERWGFAARASRGLGVTALFAGDSGTGKTLAAEVIACELGLDLYRIDLSATVSKYIGETEKNLRRIFDAAEASGAVLLFDEADALFGKRGEVKDGHDRYANLEVAYLLQRMESYRGLAILTTNLRSNVDRAFLRRLRFVVQFPFPDREQRAEIWRRTLPHAAPLDGITPEGLAGLNVPGGTIRSIALAAAFAAAAEGRALGPSHFRRAAEVEYAKAERAFTDVEREGLE